MRRLAVVVACVCALPVPVAQAWTWPVDGPVLEPFSFDRAHPYTGGQHRGVDIAAPSGSSVLAPAEGVVSFAGTVPSGGKKVSIRTLFGYTATLLQLGSIGVSRGARVGEGSVLGTVGPSGEPEHAEPYVHFGVRVTAEDQGYVDPLSLLSARPVRVAAPVPAEPATVSVAEAGAARADAPAPAAAAAPLEALPAAQSAPLAAPAEPSVAKPAFQPWTSLLRLAPSAYMPTDLPSRHHRALLLP